MIDIHLPFAALTLLQEASGEPLEGQQAVAHVLVNRVKDGRWGTTLGEVCSSQYKGSFQFSGWARNDPNRERAFRTSPLDPLLQALAGLVQAALDGEADPTGGATHYFAMSMPSPPAWVAGNPANGTPPATYCGQFGHQRFYRNVR